MKPELLEVTVMNFFGGSRLITARVRYGGQVILLSFNGRREGKPGHVSVDVEGIPVPVPYPSRYGKAFDETWVRTYVERETQKENP